MYIEIHVDNRTYITALEENNKDAGAEQIRDKMHQIFQEDGHFPTSADLVDGGFLVMSSEMSKRAVFIFREGDPLQPKVDEE